MEVGGEACLWKNLSKAANFGEVELESSGDDRGSCEDECEKGVNIIEKHDDASLFPS